MILGTAGHIDHGKSTLVRALTGQGVDRLADEQRRGITIELGFTWLTLGGKPCGVVDVPGHEDFVRTMVAGASGIDLALLVVAADDGIMPQTREHLLVLEQLGVPAGIPVITKSDLVEPAWLELLADDLQGWLASSPVRFAPPVPLSVRTGAGLEALRGQLDVAAASHQEVTAGTDDLFRLPVDRAFVVDGAGTVVTGTTWSGVARTGDEVELLPQGHRARIRRIEVHGAECQGTRPGQRTACALNGVGVQDAGRGTVVVHPGRGWRVTSRLDVCLALAATSGMVRSGERLWVHLGTAAVLGRVRLSSPLMPGTQAIARLRLEAPLVARGGDRLVIRRYSPAAVIGGGSVLDPEPVAAFPPPEWPAELPGRLRTLVARRRWGIGEGDLPVLAGVVPGAPGASAVPGTASMGGRLLPLERLEELAGAMRQAVRTQHRERPSEDGLPLESLRRVLGAPPPVANALLEREVGAGRLTLDGGSVAEPGFRAAAARSSADRARLRNEVAQDGLMPRTVTELAAAVGFDPLPVLRELERAGEVTSVTRHTWVCTDALTPFRAALQACAVGGPITPAGVRDRTGLTRKHLIPLLEWADRAGITIRDGDTRRLRGH